MKNILILGSAGQIGAYLSDYLRKKTFHVTEYDIATNSHQDLRLVGDIKIDYAIRNSDFVFFLAFDVGGSRYLEKYQNSFNFIDNNVRIMTSVFDILESRKKPFIFASSQMSNMSYSNYGILKALGESYTKSLNGRIVKFWNVYGYEKNPEKYHAITDFILSAKYNRLINMLTDGQEERDFLYATDCCEALEMVMNRYNHFTSDSPLHITSFEWTKIIDVANYIASHYDAEVVPAERKDLVQKNKRNDPDRFILDYWKPKTSISTGINKIIERINVD